MNRIRAIARAVGDRVNPIVIKELRQAVQSRLVIAILMLFLLTNVVVISCYLVLGDDPATHATAGRHLFGGLFVILVMTCMAFVPLYAGVRLAMERNDANIDLLFITTISPAAIIRGKFWAAVALACLIYSVCTPFLTLTYLLRGIDLPSIFFVLGIGLAATIVAIMSAIFVASISAGWLLRILLGGCLLFVLFWGTAAAISYCIMTMERGLAYVFSDREAWAKLGFSALVGLSILGFLYVLAVAAVTARSSNRMLPIRLFATAAWIVFGVVLGIWSWADKTFDPIMSWVWFSVFLASAALVFVIAERENWTRRVRRRIPRNGLMRLLAWPMYTGSAGGVIWCAAIAGATLLIGIWISIVSDQLASSSGWRSHPGSYHLEVLPALVLFAWCYGMTGLVVRRVFAPRSQPLIGPIIAIILLSAGCTLPILLAYLTLPWSWRIETLPIGFVLVNPMAILNRYNSDFDQSMSYLFLTAWAAIALAVNVGWFQRQWQAFRRYEPKQASPAALPVPAALPDPAAPPEPLLPPVPLAEIAPVENG